MERVMNFTFANTKRTFMYNKYVYYIYTVLSPFQKNVPYCTFLYLIFTPAILLPSLLEIDNRISTLPT